MKNSQENLMRMTARPHSRPRRKLTALHPQPKLIRHARTN
jgi:hypothetical protein